MGKLSQGLLGFGAGAALGASRVYEQQAADQEYNRRQALEEQRTISREQRIEDARLKAELAKEKRERELQITRNKENEANRVAARDSDAAAKLKFSQDHADEENALAAKRTFIEADARGEAALGAEQKTVAVEDAAGVPRGTYGAKVPKTPAKPLSLKPKDVATDVGRIVEGATPVPSKWKDTINTDKEVFAKLTAPGKDAEDRLDTLSDSDNTPVLVKSVATRLMGDVASRAGAMGLTEGGLVDPNVSAKIADGVVQAANTVVSGWQTKAASAAEWAEYRSRGATGTPPDSPDTLKEAAVYAEKAIASGKTRAEVAKTIRAGWDKKLNQWLGADGDPLYDNSSMAGSLKSPHDKLFNDIYEPLLKQLDK